MRTFIAIDFLEEVKEELSKAQKKLPEAKMTIVKKENIHLTMKFLGELNDNEVNKVKEVLRKMKFERFKAKLGEIGVFPNPSFIGVVWIGIEPKERFIEIHDKIDEELSKQGFRKDKAFESHATLARVKWLKDKKNFVEKLQKIKIKPIEFEVSSIALKKSVLTREGPVYEDIAKVEMK